MLQLIHKISNWFWGGSIWIVFLKLWITGMIIQYLLLIHYLPSLVVNEINVNLLAKYIPIESGIISLLLAFSHQDFKKENNI